MTNNVKGTAVTRLLGRLKVVHRSGVIEFELRSPAEMKKRGAKVLLRIEGLGEIPLLEDGMTVQIDALYQGNIQKAFVRVHESEDVSRDRRGDRS